MWGIGYSSRPYRFVDGVKTRTSASELAEGREEIFYISGGMLEVQPDVATILADTAVRAADLDEAAAQAAVEHAEKTLGERKAGIEYSTALTELAEATAQLRAIQMLRKRHRSGS